MGVLQDRTGGEQRAQDGVDFLGWQSWGALPGFCALDRSSTGGAGRAWQVGGLVKNAAEVRANVDIVRQRNEMEGVTSETAGEATSSDGAVWTHGHRAAGAFVRVSRAKNEEPPTLLWFGLVV